MKLIPQKPGHYWMHYSVEGESHWVAVFVGMTAHPTWPSDEGLHGVRNGDSVYSEEHLRAHWKDVRFVPILSPEICEELPKIVESLRDYENDWAPTEPLSILREALTFGAYYHETLVNGRTMLSKLINRIKNI